MPIILDGAGLSEVASAHPSDGFRGLLAEAVVRGRDVLVPAVVVAEVARGLGRTRAVESALARAGVFRITVVDTDLGLAKQVGAILHAADSGSIDLVDAHVVAAAMPFGGAIIITSDPGDIHRLAGTAPGLRIVTRRAA